VGDQVAAPPIDGHDHRRQLASCERGDSSRPPASAKRPVPDREEGGVGIVMIHPFVKVLPRCVEDSLRCPRGRSRSSTTSRVAVSCCLCHHASLRLVRSLFRPPRRELSTETVSDDGHCAAAAMAVSRTPRSRRRSIDTIGASLSERDQRRQSAPTPRVESWSAGRSPRARLLSCSCRKRSPSIFAPRGVGSSWPGDRILQTSYDGFSARLSSASVLRLSIYSISGVAPLSTLTS
jgi:hypothetical protein